MQARPACYPCGLGVAEIYRLCGPYGALPGHLSRADFLLKENVGYEVVVLYDGEQHLTKLLQPQDEETKYILVLPHIRMASQLILPNAPCLFSTVEFHGEEEPEVLFYSEEVSQRGNSPIFCPDAG